MFSILVGIDGSARGEKALAWAARYASRVEGAGLCLLSVVDVPGVSTPDDAVEQVRAACEKDLAELRAGLAAEFPALPVETLVAQGHVVDALVEAAAGRNMVVLGSHQAKTLGRAVGGAKGLRVSVQVNVPTVVVPADWNPADQGTGVVCGVGPDQVSEAAVAFAVREALALGEDLELVSAWGLPPVLSKPAAAMGGGLAPVGIQFQRELDERARLLRDANPALQVQGRSVEGPSPAKTLIDESCGKRMLVLGTHSRDALGRALFGSVTHGVLLNLSVPTVVVPQA